MWSPSDNGTVKSFTPEAPLPTRHWPDSLCSAEVARAASLGAGNLRNVGLARLARVAKHTEHLKVGWLIGPAEGNRNNVIQFPPLPRADGPGAALALPTG